MRHIAAAVLAAACLSCGSVWAAEPAAPAAEGIPYVLHTEGKTDRTIQVSLVVPLRDVAEHLGFKVTWEKGKTLVDNGKVQTTVTAGTDSYTITEGKSSRTVSLGAAPYLRHNVTYVPVDLFYELLGAEKGQIAIDGNTLIIGPLPGSTAAAPEKETKESRRTGLKGEETVAAAPAAVTDKAPETAAAPAAGLANPFQDYETIEEAEAAAGVTMTLPAVEETYNGTLYRALPGQMLEVIYEENGQEALRIRKGVDRSDVSGDYTAYDTIKTIKVDGINTRMKGRGNRVSLVTWERDGHAYSIHAENPLTIADMMKLVREIQ